MRSELHGLKGGEKQQWLRLHHEEVIAYYEAHGELATRERFNIVKEEAWQHVLDTRSVHSPGLTKADRAIARAEITEAGVRELTQEIRELKEQYGKFVPLVADELNKKFFIPLLRGKLELPPSMEREPVDSLNLADFQRKLEN
jgi:hypothetical protein